MTTVPISVNWISVLEFKGSWCSSLPFIYIKTSEFSDNFVRNITDFVEVGQKVKLKVLEVDEKNKKLKLSYKLLNKTRGVKGDIPKYGIGFKTLKDEMDEFIKKQLERVNNE